MSQVTLNVGGRKYTVACAEGEESRVESLGAEIDGKLDQLGGNLAPQEAQNLLFAALLLADELREAKLALESERSGYAEGKAAAEETAAAATRDANLANSRRDELTAKVTALESELDGLQSSQQKMNSDADDLRIQLEQRTEEAQQQRDLAEKAASTIAELERDNRALKPALELAEKERAAADQTREESETDAFEARKEVAASTAKISELTASLSAAQDAAASQPAANIADDPNLAPALERFAEMLENCAVKLEGSAASS